MRILYVTQIVPFPPHGGVLQRGYNLLRELSRRHEVHLLAFRHPDELPAGRMLDQSRVELGHFCRSVEYFDLWPKRSSLHLLAALVAAALSPQPFSVLAQRNRRLREKLLALCNAVVRPDVVHLDTIALAPYARDCGLVPAVLAHHNVESQLMNRRAQRESDALRRWYVRREAAKLHRFEAQICADFCANITVSSNDSRELSQICPDAVVETIPNGVDIDYFAPRRGQESESLIFTGGMNMFANRDGVDWFLGEVWPRVKAGVRNVKFTALGRDPSQRLLDAVQNGDRVEAPGFVADVRPAVARAAVVIVPLRVGGGTRLKVLDAMAQGKAIVSTSLGVEGIEVDDGVHLQIADRPEDFATHVTELIRDPARRLALGEAARQRVEDRYDWSTIGLRLGEVYARAVARGSK
jgi:sugar transferase (PEP-CTERM/EpsH1 system associated)